MESFLQFDSYSHNSHSPAYYHETSPDEVDHSPQFEEIIQDGKKRHLCLYEGCGKIFRFKSEIIRHHVIHFTSRPYVCHFKGCNKSFKRPDALDSHMRIHIKDLPFECEVPNCGMRFATKMSLKQHSSQHESAIKVEHNSRANNSNSSIDLSYSAYEPFKKQIKSEEASRERQEMAGPTMGSTTQPQATKTKYPSFSVSAPAPRFATSVEWEMKNPDDLKEFLMKECAEGSEYCELIVKKIIGENMLLKEKLSQCNNIVDTFNETPQVTDFIPTEVPEDVLELGLEEFEEVQEQAQVQEQASDPELLNFFGDDSDTLFLSFLKEREASYTESNF